MKHPMIWFLFSTMIASPWIGAITFRHDVPASQYFELAARFPAVGLVAGGGTGTLVAPDKVLTAAHVAAIDDEGTTGIQIRPELIGGLFILGPDSNNPTHSVRINSVTIHPLWLQNGQFHRAYDVAVLTLAEPITDVTPMSYSNRNPVTMVATLVGYGSHGLGTDANFQSPSSFDGLLRAAQNRIDVLVPFPYPNDEEIAGTLQFDFDSPDGTTNTLQTVLSFPSAAEPLALEGGAGPGDSGGPMFVDFGSGSVIVGITSSGGHPQSQTNEDELAGRYGSINEYAPLSFPETVSFLNQQGLSMNAVSYAETSWIPHITRADGGFSTRLITENTSSNVQQCEWEGFDEAGNSLGKVTQSFEPGQVSNREASAIFDRTDIAWVLIRKTAPSLTVIASFQRDLSNGSPAHVAESTQQSSRWRLHPGNWNHVFDGVALVNRGTEAARVSILQYRYDGTLLQETTAFEALEAGAKGLFVIGSPQDQTFALMTDVYFEIRATEPLAITALRGDMPDSRFLWQNTATPLATGNNP